MSAAHQAESTTNWDAEFPGDSHLISTLRACLIQADRHRRRAQTAFDQLQTALDATCLPMAHWKRPIHRLYDRFCRQKSQAEIDFFRALSILLKIFSRPKSTTYPKPDPPSGTRQPYREHGSKTHDQQPFNRTAHRSR